MKSYGTLVGELPTGVEFVLEGALLRKKRNRSKDRFGRYGG